MDCLVIRVTQVFQDNQEVLDPEVSLDHVVTRVTQVFREWMVCREVQVWMDHQEFQDRKEKEVLCPRILCARVLKDQRVIQDRKASLVLLVQMAMMAQLACQGLLDRREIQVGLAYLEVGEKRETKVTQVLEV